jgi:hypothetical protein
MLKGQANIIYNQIWLNLPMDDCHFGYITKLTPKKGKKKEKTRLQSNEKGGGEFKKILS